MTQSNELPDALPVSLQRIVLDNRHLEYDAVTGGGRRIRVRLRLDPAPWAEVEAPGEPALVMGHDG